MSRIDSGLARTAGVLRIGVTIGALFVLSTVFATGSHAVRTDQLRLSTAEIRHGFRTYETVGAFAVASIRVGAGAATGTIDGVGCWTIEIPRRHTDRDGVFG
jgi:hypothetical protein